MKKQLMDYISESTNIYIVTHIRPDGDAIGSAFALCLALKDMGKNAKVIMSSYSRRFEFLPELKDVVEEVREAEYDLLICTDCSDKKRLDIKDCDFAKAKHVVVFDHHKFSEIKCDESYIDSTAPATCEIIYNFLKENKVSFTPKIASYIYMGLMTDTGSFNYERTTANTYKIAGEMIENGAEFVKICKHINDTVPESKTKLMAYILQNTESYYNGKLRIAIADMDILNKFGVDKEDAEGMTNYLRMVEGTELAVYIRGLEEGGFKVSMRSEGNVDAANLAREFGGGGHIRAAGFDTDDAKAAKEKIIKMMEDVL